jgi:hypothetical protein
MTDNEIQEKEDRLNIAKKDQLKTDAASLVAEIKQMREMVGNALIISSRAREIIDGNKWTPIEERLPRFRDAEIYEGDIIKGIALNQSVLHEHTLISDEIETECTVTRDAMSALFCF